MKRRMWKAMVCGLMMVVLLAASMPASAASVAKIMKVNTDYARMHNISDSGNVVTSRLRKGTKVLYWGEKKDAMYKVLTSSGETGYVYGEYLSTYGAMSLKKVYVTTAATQTYKKSGSSLKKSSKLAKGKYVMVMKTSGDWVQAKTMEGKTIYMKKDNLKKAF